MVKVSPSMLSANFSKFGEEIERVERSGADWIHLDVMDGMFVPNITIGAPIIKAVRKNSELPFDVHLMIEDPIRYIDDFTKAGADILTVHTEAKGDIMGAIDKIHENGLKAGISLNPGTPVSDITIYLNKVDLVLVMTVQPGFGGQSFREEGIPKIEFLRRYADENGLRYDISVDGGINRNTGKRCADAGATVLAAGSYLFKMDDMSPEIELWHGF
ncbi:MAG: ribulose-phosphate 3-epimerase [Methanomassiliicoccales archaeon]|uniref:ribulose-phosphate 3-epimerase n=1 Tax=Candidatus Methanarcanum hacksteinii TaxID=2911857 RepID=UPI0037616249|nr:ribulose-phosphate 3-epimerase [Methanomassiliicoccales archaeon]MDD7478982.1 ribulose-phosphate 3-epimerase [Methanomassiliicoccales archaeon]